MHYTAAAAIAQDAIDTSLVIALANRECLLGAGLAAAAAIAALDARPPRCTPRPWCGRPARSTACWMRNPTG